VFQTEISIGVLFGVAALATGRGQTPPINRPWPRGGQNISEKSPPLSLADALKTFYMPLGCYPELAASRAEE
jgi:hypothetical protein